jgi:hypothetical protein
MELKVKLELQTKMLSCRYCTANVIAMRQKKPWKR